MQDVPSTQLLAPYIGGKRNLGRQIIDRIEQTPHQAYAEAFVGMAGVFLRRRKVPRVEVINDLSRDIATFFRILRRHYVPFMEMMRFQLTTRTEFERLVGTSAETLTDLERAARFLFLQRTAYAGKVNGRTFGVATDRPARFDITRLAAMLEEVHDRLSSVIIECLPAPDFIRRDDRLVMLFYLDPPYYGNEADYGPGLFARSDFERLAGLLATIKGQFILSLNDHPKTREIYAGFKIEPVETRYTVQGRGKSKPAAELLIMGP